jgi:hypothetical protein
MLKLLKYQAHRRRWQNTAAVDMWSNALNLRTLLDCKQDDEARGSCRGRRRTKLRRLTTLSPGSPASCIFKARKLERFG